MNVGPDHLGRIPAPSAAILRAAAAYREGMSLCWKMAPNLDFANRC